LLSAEKPITKKEACQILNISYNTTRLNSIIETHQEQELHREKRKAQNRGKAATKEEIKQVVRDYLTGENVSTISKYMYRSPAFVKSILDRVGVPQKPPSKDDRRHPAFLPETCLSEEFFPEEIVWSAHYHSPALVINEEGGEEKRQFYLDKYGSRCYKIYIFEKPSGEDLYLPAGLAGFYGASLAYDLGKLSHIEEMGINLRKEVA